MAYVFRKAWQGDAEKVFDLVLTRMRWMDRQGIRQWNVTAYDERYPLAYYQENREWLYVVEDASAGELLAAAMLFDTDDRWQDDGQALYVHNLVSRPGVGGAGTELLEQAAALVVQQGKRFLRLDSADDNPRLTAYYESFGFKPAGTCSDGGYHGVLREKECN